jgi:hypothetical protein
MQLQVHCDTCHGFAGCLEEENTCLLFITVLSIPCRHPLGATLGKYSIGLGIFSISFNPQPLATTCWRRLLLNAAELRGQPRRGERAGVAAGPGTIAALGCSQATPHYAGVLAAGPCWVWGNTISSIPITLDHLELAATQKEYCLP